MVVLRPLQCPATTGEPTLELLMGLQEGQQSQALVLRRRNVWPVCFGRCGAEIWYSVPTTASSDRLDAA